MSRFPPIPANDMNDEQKELYDAWTQRAEKYYGNNGDMFYYKRPSDDAFLGPYAPLLRTPGIARHFTGMIEELAAFSKPANLSPTAREIAILATGARHSTKFEMYAHARIARTQTQLSESQVKTLCEGKKPEGLDEQGSVAYDVAVELVDKKGPLSNEMWDRGVGAFGGKEGMLALVQYIGVYSFVSVYLNGCDVPIPEGEELL